MTYRKKMIEVALPLEAINKAAAREKSIRHGHPSTLHLWWARRPLAACRAVLFASLVDDPDSDPMFAGDEDIAASKRAELFNLIEELVLWENSNNSRVINRARAEIARCVATQKIEEGVLKKDQILDFGLPISDSNPKSESESGSNPKSTIQNPKLSCSVFEIRQLLAKPEQVNAFLAEHAPPVLDPFCGGGSIPLEAQRLGLRAYGSDLNPVPVLITKALIEIPPKFAGLPPVNPEWQKKSKEEKAATVWQGAQGLAEDVRYYGKRMRDEAEKRIGHLYPKVAVTAEMAQDRPDLLPYVGQQLTVIAWLWARTVASPNPVANGAHVPLVRSFWLSTKKGKEAYVQPVLDRINNTYRFTVRVGKPSDGFEPKKGTVVRTGGTCLLTGSPIPFDHIRDAGRGGRLANRLMAIIAEGKNQRVYLPPIDLHETTAATVKPSFIPDTSLPEQALGFRVQRYGLLKHGDLFSQRQLVLLESLTTLVRDATSRLKSDCPNVTSPYLDAVTTYLGLTVSKFSNRSSNLTFWDSGFTKVQQTFARQALSMIWDWIETNPFSESSGCFLGQLDNVVENIEHAYPCCCPGTVSQLDAAHGIPAGLRPMVSTDPPYYDNINYADLSDFFYLWLRRCLQQVYPTLFSTLVTPKTAELIAEPGRHSGDRTAAIAHFESGLLKVFGHVCAATASDFPATVYYAFKQQEQDRDEDDGDQSVAVSTGWEKMLDAIVLSGFSLTGTWPMRTEQAGGLRVEGRNALASSIVLVCRPRPDNASLATRKEFITALRRELPEALRNLQRGNIAPVDLAQAAIGPGMAVFTRYAKVLESDGSPMTVRTALGLINQSLDEVLAEQEGEFDGDTRWALAWFEQFGMDDGPFGDAETLSKAKNTAVNGLVEAGVIVAKAGKVRLVRRSELPEDWNPATDERLTIWEITQHLIRTLEQEGESAAAVLVHRLGGLAETARDLAYRLYNLCERKKWADEALAYNGLVIAWPELTKLALAERSRAKDTQQEMF